MDWKILNDTSQVDELIKKSYTKPQIIFKHSTTCSISSMAKMRLESKWKGLSYSTEPHFLDLLSYRHISNYIEEKTGVRHESPQLIVIYQGQPVYDASHFDISVENISEHFNLIYE